MKIIVSFNESLKKKGAKMATLNERYRIHNKPKSNKSLLVYILVFALFIFSFSFSSYVTQYSGTLGISSAKWKIKINDKLITQDNNLIKNDISLVVTENKTDDGIIKPGQKGYFDIIIDPKDTEVSLKYKIVLDTQDLPSTIQLTSYSLNNSNTKIPLPNNKTIENTILLDGSGILKSTDKKQYRIYWQWPIENGKIDNIQNSYKIKANVKLEQYIGT